MNGIKQGMSKKDLNGFNGLNNTSMTLPPVYQNPATTVMLVSAETYYADVSEIKMLLRLLLQQKEKKNEEITSESTINSQWNSCSSSLVPFNRISQKQIDKIVNIEMTAASLLTECSKLKVELQRNHPSKVKKSVLAEQLKARLLAKGFKTRMNRKVIS